MNKAIFFFICWALIACNSQDGNFKAIVNEKIDKGLEELYTENLESKKELLLTYRDLLQSAVDTVTKAKSIYLLDDITNTDNFIDSLKGVIKRLDKNGTADVAIIKNLLAEGSLGDSLNSSLNRTLQEAKDFSTTTNNKQAIDSIKANVFNSMGTGKNWQAESFKMSNSLGAELILLSLQKELYTAGIIALRR